MTKKEVKVALSAVSAVLVGMVILLSDAAPQVDGLIAGIPAKAMRENHSFGTWSIEVLLSEQYSARPEGDCRRAVG